VNVVGRRVAQSLDALTSSDRPRHLGRARAIVTAGRPWEKK
jgi:hypothetical protein